MPRILSLETSTAVCSIALHEKGRLVMASEIHQDQAHASKLSPLIDHAFAVAGWERKSLAAIAVSGGPGSYTGLRIGTSTAKGMCFALDIPLVAVDTLSIIAKKVINEAVISGYLCPMLDARRMEVYASVFDAGLNTVSPVQALVVEANSFDEFLNRRPVYFFGPGAEKCVPVIKHPNAVFLNGIYPLATQLGELASEAFEKGIIEDLTSFEPLYLKEFLVKKSTKLENVMNK